MERIFFFFYNAAVIPMLYLFFQVSRLFVPKIRNGARGRTHIWNDLRSLNRELRNEDFVLLFHCSSMGEYEQAKPLIHAIKKISENAQIAVTFLSPSGYLNYRQNRDVKLATYLPFDGPSLSARFFAELNPRVWIIVKHDLWLNHIRAAHRKNIPLVLIDANLPAHSRRLLPGVRSFYALCFNWFHSILPVSDDDRLRFELMGVDPRRLSTAGDTRYDQVYQRSGEIMTQELERVSFYENRIVFVAGSVWQSDTDIVIPAVAQCMSLFPELEVIIVPHEPTREYVTHLALKLREHGLLSQKYSDSADLEKGKVLIVDAIGILAHVYKYADICYVGGSFGPGVHNVMEPAILRKPVLFGPKHKNSFEAIELVRKKGGFEINDSGEMKSVLSRLLKNEGEKRMAGDTAAEAILSQVGATGRIVEKIREFLQ